MSIGEAAVVAARYALEPIVSVRALPGGRAARLNTQSGSLLLKRRPVAHSPRLAACHRVILQLESAGLPVHQPLCARDGSTIIAVGPWAYDLAPWVEGQRFDASTAQALGAGRALAKLHAALDRLEPPSELSGTPQRQEGIATLFSKAGHEASRAASEMYCRAWDQLEAARLSDWPVQIVHGDWHRGNVLFDEHGAVIAMLDFDEARLAPAIAEVADGAVQFATRTSHGKASDWPAETDPDRLSAFIRGYREARRRRGLLARRWTPTKPQSQAAAWFMAQSLLAQAAHLMIASDHADAGVLLMVTQKARWLIEREDWITDLFRV